AAPYIRLADTKVHTAGDVLSKYDIRYAQPNKTHLEMAVVHSLEHLFAEHSGNHSDRVIDFSPLGCQTGFYLILQGEWAEG
ncbi:S-ribosylhomocysteine lyase, partial [Cellulomonas sp. GbtcB1]|uniref:S-ribosylhomocysteine lyase n=1 Tax=Cellulomonas sp. GbtcB1 TaxID=2824746 RepID=UPI001C30DBF3